MDEPSIIPPALPRTAQKKTEPKRFRTRTTLYSPGTAEVYPDVWGLRSRDLLSSSASAHLPTEKRSQEGSAAVDPFWRAFRTQAPRSGLTPSTATPTGSEQSAATISASSAINAFSRHRTHTRAALGRGTGTGKGDEAAGLREGQKSALIFAGLVSLLISIAER